MAVGPGPRKHRAGYKTNNGGESRVRWRGLCALGDGGQNMSVPRRVMQTELGRYRALRDMRSPQIEITYNKQRSQERGKFGC